MTTTLVLNLVAALFILAALAGVTHLAHRVAGGLPGRPSAVIESVTADELERLAA